MTVELQPPPLAAGAAQLASSAATLQIAGFQPFSSVDWPGRLCATVFLQGCPWECTYCHNPALQDPRAEGSVTWGSVLGVLRARRGLLDGVVFSGGEPTRQLALADAMHEVRRLGFAVGLHTAGPYPGRLERVLPLVDWVGIDIKATLAGYERITGRAVAGSRAWASLALVQRAAAERAGLDHAGLSRPLDYEVRLTVDPTVHTRPDVFATIAELTEHGVRAPVLQEARAQGANPAYAAALAGRTLADVLDPGDLPHLTRR